MGSEAAEQAAEGSGPNLGGGSQDVKANAEASERADEILQKSSEAMPPDTDTSARGTMSEEGRGPQVRRHCV